MNLSFNTIWPERMGDLAGKPNFFIEKIWQGFEKGDGVFNVKCMLHGGISEHIGTYYDDYKFACIDKLGVAWDGVFHGASFTERDPKIHTIRYDPHNRWKPGMKIHPIINNRTKDRFQFAPTLKVKSIQKIETENMGYYQDNDIWVDDRELQFEDMELLAVNDGFPNLESFFDFFNEDLKDGWKIIHWTDLKY